MRFRREQTIVDLGGPWSFAVAERPVELGDGATDSLRWTGLRSGPWMSSGNHI